GIADGGGRRNGWRFADTDHAAFGHVVHVHHDLRHVFDAAQLVELHVRVHLPAGLPVHDLLFEQGVVEGHDDAARNLRFAALLVDDHAATLHGHDLGAAHDTGFFIDHDLGDLNTADAVVGEAGRPVACTLDYVHAEPSTCFLPRPAFVVGLVHDLAHLDGQ